MLIGRSLLLLIILSSLIYSVHKLLKIDKRFIPIFVFTLIGVIVYICGIFDVLLYGVLGVYALGGIAIIYSLIKLRKAQLSLLYISFFQLLFGIGTLIFCIQLLNTNLTHYDNFTHWAVVVKEMLITNAFPTAESVMVEFTNYPVGTASFIYFICTALGTTSEGVMIFAQGLLIFGCMSAVFGIIEEKNRFLLTVMVAAGLSLISIFNYSIRMSDLLVDFVLPMLSLATIAVIYKHREEVNKTLITIIPMLGFLMVVKSTGVIYAGIAILFLLYMTIKYRDTSSVKSVMQNSRTEIYSSDNKVILFVKVIISVALTFVPTILWTIRQNTVFAEVTNKFEVDATQMSTIFGDKTAEDVEFIVRLFISTILDISERATIGLILFQVIGIIACIVGYGFVKKYWTIGKSLIALNVVVILYFAGILAMYLFSMPLDEAIYLAGFERYAASIVIFFGVGIVMALTVDVEKSFYYSMDEREIGQAHESISSKNRYNAAVVVCLMIIALVLSSEYNGVAYNLDGYSDSLTYRVKTIAGDNWSDEVTDDTYLVYISDEFGEASSYYADYVVNYYLWTQNADILCAFYEDNFVNLVSQYDYVIIIDVDEEEEYLMNTYFGSSGEAGIYEVEDLLANVQ